MNLSSKLLNICDIRSIILFMLSDKWNQLGIVFLMSVAISEDKYIKAISLSILTGFIKFQVCHAH